MDMNEVKRLQKQLFPRQSGNGTPYLTKIIIGIGNPANFTIVLGPNNVMKEGWMNKERKR